MFEFKLEIKPDRNYATIPLSPYGEPELPFRAFISLLRAGNMHFQRRNELPARGKLFRELEIEEDRIFSLVQKHTQDVFIIDEKTRQAELNETTGDGLVTALEKPLLCVTIADCLPIVIMDKISHAFGIVHSGWKGTGIVMNAITRMERSLGSRRRDIRVVIGPGIGACCYNVDSERARFFADSYGRDSVLRKNGEHMLDLKRANINLLTREGIDDILVSGDCTSCNPLLSSFRRDGRPDFIAMLAGIGFYPHDAS